MTYTDSTGKFPRKYIDRNVLDYYVDRHMAVIKFIQNQPWISRNKLVVAGHSEGSTIAAKIACSVPKVSQLIYSGGNPCGRIVSIIEQQRAVESDSTIYGEQGFSDWKKIVENPTDMTAAERDEYKAMDD